MGLRYPDQKDHNCFFITTNYKDRICYGNIPRFNESIIDSLVFYSTKYSAKISGFVLMPSHIHLLIFIHGERLSEFMRDFKKFISQKAAKIFNISSKHIWEAGFDKVAIESEKVFRVKLNYIHNNPVKAGIVKSVESYIWSSAVDYFTERKSLIEVWKDW